MSGADKKIIIYVENDYQELDFWYPLLLRMKEEGAKVPVVGGCKRNKLTKAN